MAAETTEGVAKLGFVAKHMQAPTPLVCQAVLPLKSTKQWLCYTALTEETAVQTDQDLSIFIPPTSLFVVKAHANQLSVLFQVS